MTVPPGLITGSTPTCSSRRAAGAVTAKISVTTVDGTTLSLANLTVQQPPRATGFSPNPAPVGTTVTITGTNLGTVTAVTFNGATPVVPTLLTPTSLQVMVPPDALTGLVSLTNFTGTGASTTSFKVAPKITDFTPNTAVGGSPTVIDVTGTNLRALTGALTVKVGSMTVPPGLITGSTPTLLQFKVPLGAVTAKISVTTLDGTTLSLANLTVQQPPRATGFSPNRAPVGTTVTITGTNLAGVTEVTFSGAGPVAPLAGGTATSLKAVVPAGAVTGPVTLTNPTGTATSTVNFRVAPKIGSFTPDTAVGGSPTVIDVTGTNLQALSGALTVKVGSMTVPPGLITGSTPTLLQFKVPLGAVTAKISVTTVDGTTLSLANLTVQQPPRATGFSPNPAPVGTTVTITGTNLAGVTEVTFSGAGPGRAERDRHLPEGGRPGRRSDRARDPHEPDRHDDEHRDLQAAAQDHRLHSAGRTGQHGRRQRDQSQDGGATPVVKVGTVAAMVVDSSPTEVTFTVPALAVTAKIAITTADGTATSAPTLIVMPGSIGF